jgi:hypothetical protein
MKHLFTFLLSILMVNYFAQAPVMNPITGSSVICSSPSAPTSFTASASNTPTSYSWSVSSPTTGVVITNPSSSIASISFPYSNGTYTVYCSATNGNGTSPTTSFVVTVFETPSVSFSGSTTFCQGSSTNLSASSTILAASPTISYNWSPGYGLNTTVGQSVIANPAIPITYTVTAIKGICSNSAQITVTPVNSPTLTTLVTNSAVCIGDTTVLTAYGANTYTWTNNVVNGLFFTPAATSVYYVTGTGINGCTTTSSVVVVVNPLPTFSVSSTASVLCKGLTATITINGSATSYSYNSVPTPTIFTMSPTITTVYFISSVNVYGCKKTTSFVQTVAPCLGIQSYDQSSDNYLNVYPNPNAGVFKINSGIKETVTIFNELGESIKKIDLNPEVDQEVSGLSPGIYLIKAKYKVFKVIVTR